MGSLIPGYERLAEEERARQAAVLRIDCLPWSPTFSAGPAHVIDTAADAEAWAERLHGDAVSLMGVDTEFTFDRAPITLRNGKEVNDLSSIRPLACTVAAWCGAKPSTEVSSNHLIRLLFDLRRPEVYKGLKALFDLHAPWVAHSARAEYHCLWACGIHPTEHLLIDTYVTAVCLNLGRFHRRQRVQNSEEAVARERKLKEKAAHITSLVGQCEHYRLAYPFTREAKKLYQERFLRLGRDEVLDEGMVEYALSDAEWALRLYLAQETDVQRYGLIPHLAVIEWPLVAAVARMEWAGLPVSTERMQDYRERCRAIAKAMGERLNTLGIKPGSRDSFLAAMRRAGVVQHFVRKGKSSTKEDVLRECERQDVHPAVRPFRLYCYFQKLADSDLLAGILLGQDGRLRCSLEQAGSASGRLTSSNPNLIGLDQRLRPIVEAPPGRVLIELDYSQKEVGVAGAEWHDEELVRQFNLGDSYAGVAQLFYADQLTPEERALSSSEFGEVRRDLRKKVKNLVLGILYGKEAASIAADFKCSQEHAEAELKRFFDLFPSARDLANRAVRSSLRRGYGLTMTGLRRFIEVGDDRFKNTMRNHPIQGGACAIFKRALLLMDGYFRETSTQLLLPRHDSVLLLTPEGTEGEVIAACKILMIQALREKYPQLQPRVDAESGTYWPTELTLEKYQEKECKEEAAPGR